MIPYTPEVAWVIALALTAMRKSLFLRTSSQPLTSQTLKPRALSRPKADRLQLLCSGLHLSLSDMKGVSGGAETTSMWEASGEKSCNESSIPVWLDHSPLLKCVTVLSHPEADNTHTYSSLLKVSLAFCHTSAHHLWFWGTHQSFANQGLHSKNNNKNRKAVIKFYFYHKFPGKKWETHTHSENIPCPVTSHFYSIAVGCVIRSQK